MPKEGGGGVLLISSDRDVRMREKPKNKTPKVAWASNKTPKKIPAPKVLVSNTQKIPT